MLGRQVDHPPTEGSSTVDPHKVLHGATTPELVPETLTFVPLATFVIQYV
jgi:hypothetical protein